MYNVFLSIVLAFVGATHLVSHTADADTDLFDVRTPKMQIGLVLSSYCNDDLSYLDKFPCEHYRIRVYSKCEKDIQFKVAPTPRTCVAVSKLSNEKKDREGGTYLAHIVQHYNDLDAFTFFLQGGPETGAEPMALQKITDWAVTNSSLGFFSFRLGCCMNHWLQQNGPEAEKIFQDVFAVVTKQEYPESSGILCSLRGEFGVSARRIHAHGLNFYEELTDHMFNSKAVAATKGSTPSGGYALERLWGALFNCWMYDDLGALGEGTDVERLAMKPELFTCFDQTNFLDEDPRSRPNSILQRQKRSTLAEPYQQKAVAAGELDQRKRNSTEPRPHANSCGFEPKTRAILPGHGTISLKPQSGPLWVKPHVAPPPAPPPTGEQVELPRKLASGGKGSRNMVLIMGVGQVTHEDECMLRRYNTQLSHLGVEFSLFRDMSAENTETSPLPLSLSHLNGTSTESADGSQNGAKAFLQPELLTSGGFYEDYDAAMTGWPGRVSIRYSKFRMAGSGSRVGVCSGRFDLSKGQYAGVNFDEAASCIPKSKPQQHSIHSVFLTYWWQHCAKGVDVDNVWIIEKDAFYSGDLGAFIMSYNSNPADVIASGLQIVDNRWWAYSCYNSTQMSHISLSSRADLVANVHPVPGPGEPRCQKVSGPSGDTSGLLFHQEHVVRYSARVFGMLDTAIAADYVGPGEALVTSLCASKKFIPDCQIYDLAPLDQRGTVTDIVESNWCWKCSTDQEQRGVCKSAVVGPKDIDMHHDKWYHHFHWPRGLADPICNVEIDASDKLWAPDALPSPISLPHTAPAPPSEAEYADVHLHLMASSPAEEAGDASEGRVLDFLLASHQPLVSVHLRADVPPVGSRA